MEEAEQHQKTDHQTIFTKNKSKGGQDDEKEKNTTRIEQTNKEKLCQSDTVGRLIKNIEI